MQSKKHWQKERSTVQGEQVPHSSQTVWTFIVVGVGSLLAAALGSWVPAVYGQRGAEPGAVLLENDRVVVRHYLLEPGMSSGMHRHSRDYLVVILQGGTVEVTALNGSKQTREFKKGDVVWQTKTNHDSKNIDGSPVEGLVIEIK